MTITDEFTPSAWLRPALLQTAMASSKLRKLYYGGFDLEAEKRVLGLSCGLKTSCYVNRNPAAKGLIILFHGWLGTPQSAYVLSAAKTLFEAGYSAARMTLPEHGDATLLNSEIVDITRHSELREAVRQICADEPSLPVGLMGFSLGGNYALRIARDLNDQPIAQLQQVVAISPVIDPEDACNNSDTYRMIRRYFMRKFARLYRQKQLQFPNLFDFEDVLSQKTIRSLTEKSVAQWTGFPSINDYFAAYRIGKDDFLNCAAKVTLLTAMDDPIVSPSHAQAMSESPSIEKILTRYGGHNGFFDSFPRSAFSERIALDRFSKIAL